ncbi:hypothetical protein SNEBB_007083 [Seison nebaliae]|nr:hypothetical protein SNEBB_007083 [Seison nebaliae]
MNINLTSQYLIFRKNRCTASIDREYSDRSQLMIDTSCDNNVIFSQMDNALVQFHTIKELADAVHEEVESLRCNFNDCDDTEVLDQTDNRISQVTKKLNDIKIMAMKFKKNERVSQNFRENCYIYINNIIKVEAPKLQALEEAKLYQLKQKKNLVQFDDVDEILNEQQRQEEDSYDNRLEQMERKSYTLENMEERSEKITDIVKNLESLNKIFEDISQIVMDQGSILNRIDHNVSRADDAAKKAIKDLTRSVKLQKRSWKMRIILILFIVFVILLLILIFRKTF